MKRKLTFRKREEVSSYCGAYDIVRRLIKGLNSLATGDERM